MRNRDNNPTCRNSTPASLISFLGEGNIDLPLATRHQSVSREPRGLFRLRQAESSLVFQNNNQEVQLERTGDTKRGRGRLTSPQTSNLNIP